MEPQEGIAKQVPVEAPELWMRSRLDGRTRLVRQTGLLHSIDVQDGLLLGMRQGHVVLLAFRALLDEVGSKGGAQKHTYFVAL